MSKYQILVVDDEEPIRSGLSELIQEWGYDCRACASADEALRISDDSPPHVVLSDLMMPGMGGFELMTIVRERYPQAAFIMLTGYGTIENAIQAMQEGANDYFTKPVDLPRLKVVLEKALEGVSQREEMEQLRLDLAELGHFGPMVGSSRVMRDIYRVVRQTAPSKASVLITGESGTGKEIVARTLHVMSIRKNRPFIAVNCAAIPETLLESEIFGHERGAFTGATAARIGCFELANGGSLLLDEIGEMSPELQAKLLRVLEERHLRRVGGIQEFPVDVRVISSTNIDITEALRKGSFREDLYYRLNVFTIHLPPLRERRDDIPLLARHFLAEFASANARSLDGYSPAAMEALTAHDWPGNVRELKNVVERAVIVTRGPLIDLGDLPGGAGRAFFGPSPDRTAAPAATPGQPGIHVSVGTTVEEAERLLILETLRSTNDNKTRAAEILGISTKTLHNKLKRYGRKQGPG